MVFLESSLGSNFNPLVALGRNGSLGLSGFVNKFNADAELLDDLVNPIIPFLLARKTDHRGRRTITGRPSITRCALLQIGYWLSC